MTVAAAYAVHSAKVAEGSRAIGDGPAYMNPPARRQKKRVVENREPGKERGADQDPENSGSAMRAPPVERRSVRGQSRFDSGDGSNTMPSSR